MPSANLQAVAFSYACLPEGGQSGHYLSPDKTSTQANWQTGGMCVLPGMTGWSTLSNLHTYKEHHAAPQSCVATPGTKTIR